MCIKMPGRFINGHLLEIFRIYHEQIVTHDMIYQLQTRQEACLLSSLSIGIAIDY